MLLSELHFWTTQRDEVRIKCSDLGAFRYQRQREVSQELRAQSKRDYTERRNGLAVLKNSRKAGGRLKDNLKKLEDLLRTHKLTHSEWQDAAQVLLLFDNGIIAHICVDIYTGDILRMVFDKYLVGKLAGELITDAFFTRSHIVLAYNTNQLTVVHLQRPNARPLGPEKIANMEPRIFHVIIPGLASERKLARHLTVNSSRDLFVVWTQSSQNEVYPWRPTIRDQDRANIHIFKLKALQLESLAYCWSENDPLCVDFLRSSENQIITLEQKVSRKGDISAEICSYELATGKMQRTAITSIAMGTQICCFAFSPDQEKLFLGSIDRNICLHDLVLQTTKYVKQIEIVPTQCAWHCDSALLCVSNERSVLQCFDLALSPIGNQLLSESVTPTNLLDLSHYFATQPTLLSIAFSRKPDLANFSHKYAQTDCLLLLLYENGPLGCLRFFGGAGMRGDIHNSGLTADVIADKYLRLQQPERAVNVLASLNWETYGAMCLITLHKIANYVFFSSDQRRPRCDLMARALSTFAHTLSEDTKDEFSDQVYDLKRRFCFFLMRKNQFSEAFEIAHDIADYDLFMDLYNLTKCIASLSEFAQVAFGQAAAIIHGDHQGNLSLTLASELRPDSACSQLSYTTPSPQTALKNYVPPLPSFKSKIFNAEMIKINIPKPELRPALMELRAPKLSGPTTNTSTKGGSHSAAKQTTLNGADWSQDVPDQTVGLPLPLSLPGSPSLHPQQGSQLTSQIGSQQASQHGSQLTLPYHQPKFYQHPLVSGNIPAMLPALGNEEHQKRLLLKKPTASILSNAAAATPLLNGETPSVKSTPVEKNKVKFSDTIQVAVVPEIPRKEKPLPPKRNGYSRPAARHLTNPRKELADSLPLCHPNDEYLKDFNPITTNVSKPPTRRRGEEEPSSNSKQTSSSSSSIKVVHFGVV
ncbi:WD repeat-containing and planar cell polarity effector protein fritz [Drosophila hydei]|uniref:WD repeat-containing and planar cell polarity effector protein fritz n=1 Tax=Drosophila hydei TaxID=7224 RepID=A0A6J1LW73_DROHY|nr:WD repeat-containing and planar cell polarity effector protein fritz [Drosophila hydei]